MGKQLRETPAPPRARAGDAVPRSVDAVVVRAMQKRPEDRYASAGAMREALCEALRGPARRRERVRRAATIVLSAAAMLFTAGVAARWERARASAAKDSREAREQVDQGPESSRVVASVTASAPAEPPAWPAWDADRRPALDDHTAERVTSPHGRAGEARAPEIHRRKGDPASKWDIARSNKMAASP
jgi:hypothetical protein